MSRGAKKPRPHERRKRPPSRTRLILWFLLPTVLLVSLLLISTFWRLPTRVHIDLATARLAFTLGGEELHEILDRSVPFSSLVVEDCSTVAFAAKTLTVADPRQLVPATGAGAGPSIPAGAWSEVTLAGPVRFLCRDPSAKLTLNHPDPAAPRLGLLDRIHLAPGSQVVLEVSPGQEPALGIEIATPQELNLALDGPDLELVTDFVESVGIAVPFQGDLLTWRARLPAARRTFEIVSGEQGLALIVTPEREQVAALFRQPLDLPLASVELLAEELEGPLASPLREKATLSYPDYPDVSAVTIEQDEALGLGGLSQARLKSLAFDAEISALRARFDGIARRATSRSGEFVSDYRLTLFHTFFYSWRWELIASATVWLLTATWAVFKDWKTLRG